MELTRQDKVLFQRLNQGALTCSFLTMADLEKVISIGPWNFKGSLLFQKWDTYLVFEELDFTSTEVWVQVHNLPHNKFNVENAFKIGAFLGELAITKDGSPNWMIRRQLLRLWIKIPVT